MFFVISTVIMQNSVVSFICIKDTYIFIYIYVSLYISIYIYLYVHTYIKGIIQTTDKTEI